MNRRDTIKSLLIGGVAGGTVLQVGCQPAITTPEDQPGVWPHSYGRTPKEQQRDEELLAEASVLTTEELTTIAILCDIILPANETAGSAVDAEVPAFIDFIIRDLPTHQVPLKGGLLWLDAESVTRFQQPFRELDTNQQLQIIDDIAYPETAAPEMSHGVRFFNQMRDLTLTGYFTSKMGLEDLGYQGNRPNVWDGVPEDVLQKHGLAYEPEWIAKCVDQTKRSEVAKWDDAGNLLS